MCEVLQTLGLTNFFIKYIPGYANLIQPLTNLSKKHVQLDWKFYAYRFSQISSMHTQHLQFWYCLTQASSVSLFVMLLALALVLCCRMRDLLPVILGK